MPEAYSYFRPLLAADQGWHALAGSVADREAVDAGELAASLVDGGGAALAKGLPLILASDPKWLLDSEFVDRFDADQTVFVLPASVLADPPMLRLCADLRRKGRHLGVEMARWQDLERLPPAAFDYLQLDASQARSELSAGDWPALESGRWRTIAVNVASVDSFEWLMQRGVALCDARFVTLLDPTVAVQPDLSRLKVLKLLSLVIQDADSAEIEEVFRQEARLSYNLLRLVNSVAVGAKTRISSFHQAIALLGRRQLQRWLQLLIYADQMTHANKPNPLLQLAAERGRQMELLTSALTTGGLPERSDAAFMTGIFSLLDVLLRMPMGEILGELPLPSAVAEALSAREGELGTLLAAVVAGEGGEPSELAQAERLFSGLGISPACHALAQLGAFDWASRINSDR